MKRLLLILPAAKKSLMGDGGHLPPPFSNICRAQIRQHGDRWFCFVPVRAEESKPVNGAGNSG